MSKFYIIPFVVCFALLTSYKMLVAETSKINKVVSLPTIPPASIKWSPADSANPALQYMSNKIDSIYKAKRLLNNFNGCVLVAKQGKPIYIGCFGYANQYTKDTLTAQSSFQLASVSKTLTATAILMLKEQGKLSLDDSVQVYYPDFPYHGVRVRDLLSHRSGLPNYLYFGSSYWTDKNLMLTNWHIMDIMARKKPKAAARPNTGFSYCNTNYVVLAAIIERISGMSYKDFMETQVFYRLGMRNSFVFDYTYSSRPNLTYGFDKRNNIDAFTMYDGVTGDKGVYSSVEDLFIFDQALYSGSLISQATQNEAYTPLSFERPSRKNYGFGWRMMQQPDNSYLTYHNGWWHSYHTLFHRFTQQQTTIIALSNRHDRVVYDVDDIYRIVNSVDVLLEADE